MALTLSTGLATALAGTSSLKGALDGCAIQLYSGAVPTSADDGLGAAVMLCSVLLDGTDPLVFSHADTTVGKPTGDVWGGINAASGAASFFRLAHAADTGSASTSDVRVQGTVGLTKASDMVLQNTAFTSGLSFQLNNFVLNVPFHK